jgi:hypothetical protein
MSDKKDNFNPEAIYWAIRDIDDSSLTLLQHHILIILATTLGKNGYSMYGTDQLMRICRVKDRKHFIKTRDELVSKGYLILIKKGGRGRNNCNYYGINFYKIIGEHEVPFELGTPLEKVGSAHLLMKIKVGSAYLLNKIKSGVRLQLKVGSAHPKNINKEKGLEPTLKSGVQPPPKAEPPKEEKVGCYEHITVGSPEWLEHLKKWNMLPPKKSDEETRVTKH